jgi:hypothetical protein
MFLIMLRRDVGKAATWLGKAGTPPPGEFELLDFLNYYFT